MINYPPGQNPKYKLANKPKAKTAMSLTSHASRGMTLEDRLNKSNLYYLEKGIAVIHKKPTPIQVVKVDYPKRSAACISEAYYRQASTTDYNGVYQGHYIDFEAKETRNKTRFPLSNLPDHQIHHMRSCRLQGGICFLIIYFRYWDKIFLLPFEALDQYLQAQSNSSLTYEFIEDQSYLCPQGLFPMIDYIQALDEYFLNKGSTERKS